MATKYIVDNLPNQTITGDLTINGNLSVTGVTNGNLTTYKALLTQRGVVVGTGLSSFSEGLIIGETYTIVDYISGDDFSNIANVTSGIINTSGCTFIAIGEIPANWNNGSTLESSGNLAVNVLENNLGYDIEWVSNIQPGLYFGFNSTTGPLYNNFNRNSTFINIGEIAPLFGPTFYTPFASPIVFNQKDDSIILGVFDPLDPFSPGIPDQLYYFPVEIQILKDSDTTPVVITGTTTTFPFTNVSIDLICGEQTIQYLYTSGGTIVNDISEVVTILNNDTNTNFLGTFSDDGFGGINLTIATNLQTQFCANNTLTFYVFND